MMKLPDLNPDSMTAEVNYRRERLTDARYAGQTRVRRPRLRRTRTRTAT